ncbi:MAG TPA: restriction endonuclease subunit M [Candidatus Accumulibacter sp.]|nr:restriction endonuclease subunit M [Accumulibacter sp.]
MQNPLSKPLRSQLENTVKSARDVAEKAALAALHQLGVGDARLPEHLDEARKALRRRLRAHGRSLGDVKSADDSQGLTHLKWEVAYEHWHRMLFARFLAENHLLLWEPGAPVTLAECEELAQDPSTSLGARSGWELAGKLAARMLPQVFKANSPVFELRFSPNEQRDLENLLQALPTETFAASDSLGWVYQFWQAKRKDEVNASEVKISADELPAVTQLFTEPYMVEFLLHNSLGAWWHTRHPGKPCPEELTYLRTLEDGTPAAGKFEGWPDRLSTFKLLDPCCGSGHFLVVAFLLLVPMRMAAEGLSAREAVDAVLRDNLHGLEIDPRCVEIAVFALAFAAWRYPDETGNPLGVRIEMPVPSIACCGLKVAARPQDWEALVPDDAPNAAHLREGLSRLHETFAQAPLLGSLLDPSQANKGDLFAADYPLLADLLGQALASERQIPLFRDEEDRWELALSAQGLMEAARLLDARYHLVVTNVPYLARGKQSDELKQYCEYHYPEGKNDLANVFLKRCLQLAKERGAGTIQIVMPENWLYLTTYRKQRETLLAAYTWPLIAKLGFASFQVMDWWAFGIILLTIKNSLPTDDADIAFWDCSSSKEIATKSELLSRGRASVVMQSSQLRNPDSRVTLTEVIATKTIGHVATALQGIKTGDDGQHIACFWELSRISSDWRTIQSTVETTVPFGGLHLIVRWANNGAAIARLQGRAAWSRPGVAVSLMNEIRSALFIGQVFDSNVSVITPRDPLYLASIWAYGSSSELNRAVKEIEPGVKANNGALTKVGFDYEKWQQVAAEYYPNGLPRPHSDDPTQWIFHGHPQPATDPLQVAVARLLGYTWPGESDDKMELSDEARTWIARCQSLSIHADDDGIVCLPAVRGEKPAHERLLGLLIDAWEKVEPGSWKPSMLDQLLADADCAGKALDVWLREKFFEQHARRFHHRPFIWHIWDGLKDGFGALVNYHRLDNKNLERLIHTYLGDWIRSQEDGVKDGVDGAQTRLAAARNLKTRLEAILDGETPHDIFVRWKPLPQQPIGWHPDLNDGVRLNIRPFMTAEVLRQNRKPKLNITWDKDRGKDVESAPWFAVFKGERINGHHLTLAEKRAARGDG